MEVLSKEDTLAAIAEATAPLQEEIAILREFLPGTMNHKQAAVYIGVSENTLARIRDLEANPIRYAKEGTKLLYDVSSLIEYRKQKFSPITRKQAA